MHRNKRIQLNRRFSRLFIATKNVDVLLLRSACQELNQDYCMRLIWKLYSESANQINDDTMSRPAVHYTHTHTHAQPTETNRIEWNHNIVHKDERSRNREVRSTLSYRFTFSASNGINLIELRNGLAFLGFHLGCRHRFHFHS